MPFSNIEIPLANPKRVIRGLRHSSGTKHRVLCLHGWLDNANSFQPIMPLLLDCDIVAIDLPGHGHSDHFESPYSIANNAHHALQVASQLGWDSFHLIGHSLGGCIAPFCAVANPNAITGLTLIDAAGPQTETPEQLPARITRFHQDQISYLSHQSRIYDSIEQAVESRLRATKMAPASAHLIVERQLQETDNGYQWRFDQLLRAASANYYTENQVKTILAAVDCPVQCILADDGYILKRPDHEKRLACISKLHLTTLPGHHHLHMDTPEPVAHAINQFLAKRDKS